MVDIAGFIGGLFALMVFVVLYFLPAFVAYKRNHNNFAAITALNLLAGFTFLGWVASMVWAWSSNVRQEK